MARGCGARGARRRRRDRAGAPVPRPPSPRPRPAHGRAGAGRTASRPRGRRQAQPSELPAAERRDGTARARRASHPHPAHPRNSRRGCGARLLNMRCSERRCMPSRRAVSLTSRSHCSTMRRICGQHLRSAPSGVPGAGGSAGLRSNRASTSSASPAASADVVSTGARRQDRRGEAADVGDDDDPHACVPFAQLLDQLQAVVSEPHPGHNVGEQCRGGGSGRHRAAGAGNGEPIRYQRAAAAAAGVCFVLDLQKRR
jgi:hypothetical protein